MRCCIFHCPGGNHVNSPGIRHHRSCRCCIYLCKWAAKSWQSRRSLTRDTMRREGLFSAWLSAPPPLDGSTRSEVIISAASRSFVLGEFLGFYGRADTHTVAATQPSYILADSLLRFVFYCRPMSLFSDNCAISTLEQLNQPKTTRRQVVENLLTHRSEENQNIKLQ